MIDTPNLVISSSRIIHVDTCPHVAGYVDGKRVSTRYDMERPLLDATYPDESTQVLRFGPYTEVEHRHVIDAQLKPSDLDRAYRRCRTCSPDVPEWPHPLPTVRRKLGTLSHKDIGRQTTEGELTSVMHMDDRVLVDLGERIIYGAPDETIDFYVGTTGKDPGNA